MTWAEFRRWVWKTHKLDLSSEANDLAWRVIWREEGTLNGSAAGIGSGHEAVYGDREQRRLTFWLRMRYLVALQRHGDWMRAADGHIDGWLVNDGSGIRWMAEPEEEAYQLVERGFVAVKCGL